MKNNVRITLLTLLATSSAASLMGSTGASAARMTAQKPTTIATVKPVLRTTANQSLLHQAVSSPATTGTPAPTTSLGLSSCARNCSSIAVI